jgi:hypothetical protein
MGLDPKLSFSSGELDPILHDNVTLEKFKKGLATARNVIIGKTGAMLSRFSREQFAKSKNNGQAIKIFCPPNSGILLEFGNLYCRVHNAAGEVGSSLQVELVTTLTEADIATLHFAVSKNFVYIFCAGKKVQKLELLGMSSAFVAEADIFEVPNPLTGIVVTGTGAGYEVDYLVALVINGEESIHVEDATTGYGKPVVAGQANIIATGWTDASVNYAEVSEVRVYSRPFGGGAYGLLGTTTKITVPGAGLREAKFEDIGSVPDYTNGVQDLITRYGLGGKEIIDLKPKTGTIYQQRLLITTEDDSEAILASRPGHHNNFYRDFPYAADSALNFKSGTSGKAEVLRIIESDGLIVFTTIGIYTSLGVLGINNLALEKRGGWVINENIPPLIVPGGLFFVDNSNVIRQLVFSQEILAYESVEQSIFSNHLFKNKPIVSWCYQSGTTPLIIVSFLDGSFATFTYNFEQQMRAWTRHDSVYPVEQLEGTNVNDISFFVTNKDGNRYIERTLPRYVPFLTAATDPESDKSSSTVLMDAIYTYKTFVDFADAGDLLLVPDVADTWDGVLTLTGSILAGVSTVGSIVRWFNPEDKTAIDLVVTAITTPNANVKVQPSEEFPEDYAVNPRLYRTTNTVVSLTHLEGEQVSVVSDGYLVASPLNDVDGYPVLTVTGGTITLPDDMYGAIIHVGRPVVADIKTLNISTVEQSPTLIESINVNKLYIKVQNTRGLFLSNEFPEEAEDLVDGSSVEGMEDLDFHYVPRNGAIIGNRYPQPASIRLEKTLPGSWNSQGKISLRQVDPFHFEILSIIPDVEVLKRSDR